MGYRIWDGGGVPEGVSDDDYLAGISDCLFDKKSMKSCHAMPCYAI